MNDHQPGLRVLRGVATAAEQSRQVTVRFATNRLGQRVRARAVRGRINESSPTNCITRFADAPTRRSANPRQCCDVHMVALEKFAFSVPSRAW